MNKKAGYFSLVLLVLLIGGIIGLEKMGDVGILTVPLKIFGCSVLITLSMLFILAFEAWIGGAMKTDLDRVPKPLSPPSPLRIVK